MTDLSPSREKDKINPVVFHFRRTDFVVFPDDSLLQRFFRGLDWPYLNWVSRTFGWYYLLAATLYIVFVVCIACSRFGSVKLGPEHSKPEFSCSAGRQCCSPPVSVGLMFFSVAEPVTQYMPAKGRGDHGGGAPGDGVDAVSLRLTGWSMYARWGWRWDTLAIVIIYP
jgi:choline/glycine/proline betaine transport protein